MGLIGKIEEKLSSNKSHSSDMNNQEVGSTHVESSERPVHTSDSHLSNTASNSTTNHPSIGGLNGQDSHSINHTGATRSSNVSNIHPAMRGDNTHVTDFGDRPSATSTGLNNGFVGSEGAPLSSNVGNSHHIPGSNAQGFSASHGLNNNGQTGTFNTNDTQNPVTSQAVPGATGPHTHSTSANPLAGSEHVQFGSTSHGLPGSNDSMHTSNTSHGVLGNSNISHPHTSTTASDGLGNTPFNATPGSNVHNASTAGQLPTDATTTTHAGRIPGSGVHEQGREQHVVPGSNGGQSGGVVGNNSSTNDTANTRGTADKPDHAPKTGGLTASKENYDAIPEAGGLKVGSGPFEHDRSYNPTSSSHSHGLGHKGTDHSTVHSHGQTTHSTGKHNLSHDHAANGLSHDQSHHAIGHNEARTDMGHSQSNIVGGSVVDQTGQHNLSHDRSANGLSHDQSHHTIGHNAARTDLGHNQNNVNGGSVVDQPLHGSTHMSSSNHNGGVLDGQNVPGIAGSNGTSSNYNQSMAQHQADQMMR